MLRAGDIVDVFVAHITPPHRKYYVIACIEPVVLGFFINSAINRYIERRPELRRAQLQVPRQQYPFLRYDSWLDCSDVHTFDRSYLEREVRTNPPAYLGRLSDPLLSGMIATVRGSYTLATDHMVWICRAFNTDPDANRL